MNASKLGPTNARAMEPIATAATSQCQEFANTSGIKPITPNTLPMAIARKRPNESEIQPPRICKKSGTICETVKNNPIWGIDEPRSLR